MTVCGFFGIRHLAEMEFARMRHMDNISARLFITVVVLGVATTIFLRKAEITWPCATFVLWCTLGNASFDLVILVLIFEIPDAFWQLCRSCHFPCGMTMCAYYISYLNGSLVKP